MMPYVSTITPLDLRGMGLGDDAPVTEEALAAGRRDAALANEAGIPVPVLRSIRAVESSASPSAVRFEPHLFWRTKKRLPPRGTTGEQIRAAMSPSDASSVPYTPGPTQAASRVSSETNRAAFERAFRVDPVVAVKSTSWGSYQVLGEFLLRIFRNDPRRSVEEFDRDPAHLSDRIFASWMDANPRARLEARSLNFANFAHRYNGCRDCSRYEAGLTRNYARLEPEWRAIAARVGVPTPSTFPRWAPAAIVSGVVVGALGIVGGAAYLLRPKKKRPVSANKRMR